MTNEEINEYIHEKIMGRFCNHESAENVVDDWVLCHQCGDGHRLNESWNIPDYCSDDSPRRLLNEVVAGVLSECDHNTFDRKLVFARQRAKAKYWAQNLAASAEQIARACVEAHKEANK